MVKKAIINQREAIQNKLEYASQDYAYESVPLIQHKQEKDYLVENNDDTFYEARKEYLYSRNKCKEHALLKETIELIRRKKNTIKQLDISYYPYGNCYH